MKCISERLQSLSHRGGMMGKILINPDALYFSPELQSPADPAEIFQPVSDIVLGNTQPVQNARCRQCVADVIRCYHFQPQVAEHFFLVEDVEAESIPFVSDVPRSPVAIEAKTKGLAERACVA